ncbi:thioester reductase domain-containing protein [Nocardia sp. NPDC088792]|uniref:thioester reductase domain-containing protein n=1 Tax=Nocardia sp. NPDC088792 TaxID=3364332 RepID=UPI0037FB9A14
MIDPADHTSVRNSAVDRRTRGESLERGSGAMDITALLARTSTAPSAAPAPRTDVQRPPQTNSPGTSPADVQRLPLANSPGTAWTDIHSPPAGVPRPSHVEVSRDRRQWDPDTLAAAITTVANRFAVTPMDADTDFFDAGGTSLAAVELLAALGRELGIDPDLDTVFFDARPRRLAHRWLADHPDAREVAREADTDDLAQLFADLAGADRLPLVAAAERVAPQCILLTGATGFLGSHLLLDLLRHSQAHVVCLVRAEDDGAAAERLREALRGFALPASREVMRRVTALAGDLRLPRLGLSEERWGRLGAEVDSIVNAGAAVDFLRGYPSLRRTNVLGPLTLAELACTGRPKPLHHISSLAVFNGSEAATLGEDEPTANVAELPIGYDRSKWAAEALLERTGRHGLVVTVLRPGGIGGHPETGAHNPRDLNAGISAALMRFRTVPGFRYLNAAPVDWVSRVAAQIVATPSAWGHTYHLTGAPTSLEQVMAETTLGGLGVRVLHWEQWCADVVRAIREEPVPELESLAQVLQSPVARRQLAAMVTAPPATAARTDAFVAAHGLPAPASGAAARGKMLETIAGLGPRPGDEPYLRFNETLSGTIGPVGATADIPCELRLSLSVASSAQAFSARTLDVSGELLCAALHDEPLTVAGTATIRPHDGTPLRHEMRHPIMHYQLTLHDSSGGSWWLDGYKFAAARRRLVRQLGTQVIEIGRTGEPASHAGEVAVPMHTYLPDQIDGIEIDPRLPERQQRLAKLLWLSWFGGQLGKSLMEPVLRVGTDLLDLRRAMRKEHRR